MVRRHCKHHSFLSLADPDFRVTEALILERRSFQMNIGAEFLPHLPDSRTEPSRPAVGDRAIKPLIACFQEHVEQFLFCYGVADLDCAARDFFRFARQLDRRECSAMDAIATGAAPKRDNEISRLGSLLALAHGDNTNSTAVNQRIAEIARIETDGAVDRGDAHAIAVVPNAGDNAFHDFLGMQDPLR